jgi:hypothetical protein
MVLSSASTGSTSSTPTLNVITMPATEGRPAVEQEPSESSQFPLGIWKTNVDSDALADPPPEAAPIAEVFSVKAAMDFVFTIIGMMNPTKLKSEYLVSEKTVGDYLFVLFHNSSFMMSLNDTNRRGRV